MNLDIAHVVGFGGGRTLVGVGGALGAGLVGVVAGGFFLGAEFVFNPDIFAGGDPHATSAGSSALFSVQARALAGWKF